MNMLREVTMSDGNTRPVERPSNVLEAHLNRLAHYSEKAGYHHKLMRAAADAAGEQRKAIASLMRAAGISDVWHNGTLYRLSNAIDVVAEDCPEACDVVLPSDEPAGNPTPEEMPGGMDEPTPPARRRAGSFQVNDLVEFYRAGVRRVGRVVKDHAGDNWVGVLTDDGFTHSFQASSPCLRPAAETISITAAAGRTA